jgi:chaperonin GroES
MKTNFTMLKDLIMVYPIKAKQSTASGLIITSIDRTAPGEGFVLAVGPGAAKEDGTLSKMPCTAGDRIVYAKSDLKEVKYGDDTLHVIPATQVLARLVPEE